MKGVMIIKDNTSEKTLVELRDHINCTLSLIHGIKYKNCYKSISDLYFNKNSFPKFKRFNDYRN